MKKYSIKDIVHIINREGWEYAEPTYRDYVSCKNIEEEELGRLWNIVGESMDAVKKYIETQMGKDFKWE